MRTLRRPPLTLLTVAGLGLAMAAAFAIWGTTVGWRLPDVISAVPDDAFYYLEGARRARETGVVSVDGIHPASGYHPAWMALLVLMVPVAGDSAAFLGQALVVSQVFVCLSALLIFWYVRAQLPSLALPVAVAWLLNPLTLLLAVQVTEAGVYMCLLILACTALLRGPFSGRVDRVDAAPTLVLAGAALGGAFYGRTEVLVVIATACVCVPWLPPAPASVAMRLRRAGWLALGFGVTVLPWHVFLWATTGALEQASGAVKQVWAADEWIRMGLVGRLQMVLRMPVGLAGMSALAGLTVTLVWRGQRPDLRALAAWAFATAALLASVYVVRVTDYQVWHLAGMAVLCAVGTVALAAAHELQGRVGPAPALIAAALVGLAGWYSLTREAHAYPWQRAFYDRQTALEAWVPAGETIAVMNAGISAYFSDRVIVAADGLMNDQLVPAWVRGDVDRALRAEGIRYLIDTEAAVGRLRRFSTSALVAEPLHCVPMAGRAVRLCVWRLDAAPTVAGSS